LWAQVHYWFELGGAARRATRLSDRLRTFVERPGWRPAELGGAVPAPEVSRESYRKFEVPLPRGLSAYVLLQFLPALFATWFLLARQDDLPRAVFTAGAAGVIVTLVCLGGLLERRAWAIACEAVRVLALAALALLLGEGGPASPLVGLLLGTFLLAWLWRYRSLALAGAS
jgi:hypothetical protein